MKLLRITSIAGVPALMSALNVSVTANEDAIGVINGDEATTGSILNALKLNKEYIDSVIGNVDLRQIGINLSNIIVLNSDLTVDGSIDKAVDDAKLSGIAAIGVLETQLLSAITSNGNALSILNGNSTVAGSVDAYIASVIGTAPEGLRTYAAVSDLINDLDTLGASLRTALTTNATYVNGKVSAIGTAEATSITAVATSHSAGVQNVADYRATVKTAFDAASALTYCKKSDNLSNLTDFAVARANLGILSTSEANTAIVDNASLHRVENVTVSAGGSITLDSRVRMEHVRHIHVPYVGGTEFDLVTYSKSGGTYLTHFDVAGDLNGLDVEVKYVLDQSILPD